MQWRCAHRPADTHAHPRRVALWGGRDRRRAKRRPQPFPGPGRPLVAGVCQQVRTTALRPPPHSRPQAGRPPQTASRGVPCSALPPPLPRFLAGREDRWGVCEECAPPPGTPGAKGRRGGGRGAHIRQVLNPPPSRSFRPGSPRPPTGWHAHTVGTHARAGRTLGPLHAGKHALTCAQLG